MNADATKTVEEFTAEAQKTLETNVETLTKSVEDATTFGRETMDAMVLSSKRAAKAAEEMNAELAAFAKKSYEDGLAAAKDMGAAKSVTELFEKQATYTKSNMDAMVAQMTKVSEMVAAASKDCFEPLSERMTAATDLMKVERA
ncbi:MAG: phasin family protein [Pseudomonadota bacterium]